MQAICPAIAVHTIAFDETTPHMSVFLFPEVGGQRLLVDTGHVAMFEPSVSYDIQMVKGIRNILFGGEGLFFVSLTGPGRIWLQTMPMTKLAGAIRQYLPQAEGSKEQGINIKLG